MVLPNDITLLQDLVLELLSGGALKAKLCAHSGFCFYFKKTGNECFSKPY